MRCSWEHNRNKTLQKKIYATEAAIIWSLVVYMECLPKKIDITPENRNRYIYLYFFAPEAAIFQSLVVFAKKNLETIDFIFQSLDVKDTQ